MTITTHTTWNREFTTEELKIMEDRRAKLIAEGVVYGQLIYMGGTAIREWATEELANGWVAFANSLNPPPEKIEIVVTDN
jgi:hypothetical protein